MFIFQPIFRFNSHSMAQPHLHNPGDDTVSQILQALIELTLPSIVSGSSSIKLLGTRVYKGRLAVFDYSINGRTIAFDVGLSSSGKLRVEVFDRKSRAREVLSALNYESLGGSRFLVCELQDEKDLGKIADNLSKAISGTAAEVAALGAKAEDRSIVDCINLDSPIVVADVGANPLSEPPYSVLKSLGLCYVVGFEPQPDAFQELEKNKTENEGYFPFAVGAPGEVDLNIYKSSGFTSCYEIDDSTIDLVASSGWFAATRVQKTVKLECKALDDILGLPNIDLLKIDIQGGELNVFRHARRVLASSSCIISEVGFVPLYKDAPSFADVHQELVSQDFMLHKFLFQKQVLMKSRYASSDTKKIASQLIDGDAVYVKDCRTTERMASRHLKVLALLGHFVFHSYDLVLRMLDELQNRGEVADESVKAYIDSMVS